jgi:hypothetical protein
MNVAVIVPSNPVVSVVIAVLLYAASRPIIRRVAVAESNPWLVRILTISLILHLLAAPAQIFVVDHFYHGIADWKRYDNQGSILAPEFRHFDFSFANANVRGIVNDGSVSIATGIVMAIVGVNQLGAFLVFSWLSWLGVVMFYRAFTLSFPGALAGHRRYAIMLFFLPSMIFWTADVSKEAIMMLSLGASAYGASKVLARRRGGFSLLAVGVAIGILIRPNELLILLGGFAVALTIRPAGGPERAGGIKRIGGLAFMGSLLALSVFLTFHYLHTSGGSLSLNQTAQNNTGVGVGFGSSNIAYSSSPFYYWRDIYTVLFDPLPITAHGSSQLIASLENMVIGVLILVSFRQLRMVVRASFARPYVMLCVVYSLLFLYAFAALGNLGLITRERALLFPFFLVLLCIPRTPRGRPPRYDWELKRRARNQRRRAIARGVAPGTPSGLRRPHPVAPGVGGEAPRGVPEMGPLPREPGIATHPDG